MPMPEPALNELVTRLVPSLSNSLAEQFNVFRVMHHGTHEKQLSNVFAWLLRADGTHGLGDAFQKVFVQHVNAALAPDSQMPLSGYRIAQEVNTSGHDSTSKDIADIVLTTADDAIVVENFESSDGHGHDYGGYLSYGLQGRARAVVVLLCSRVERHRLTHGWQDAAVVTYSDVLQGLKACVEREGSWRKSHTQQHFFIDQMIEHFLEGPAAVSTRDQLVFIATMCATGESERFTQNKYETAAQEFADLIAQHARNQFETARETLFDVRQALRLFSEHTLIDQVNSALATGLVTAATVPFRGGWSWSVKLERADGAPSIFLEFGPTAVRENEIAPDALVAPDYEYIFATREGPSGGIDWITQTDVRLDELLAGLEAHDTRLRDAVLDAASDA